MSLKLHVKNFTVFADNLFEFSDGINVLIGKNSTGKTHLLKLITACYRTFQNKTSSNGVLATQFSLKLLAYFRTESIKNLIHNSQIAKGLSVALHSEYYKMTFTFSNRISASNSAQDDSQKRNIVFLPTDEMMATFEGFISLYQKREIPFDESYYQLALALDTPPLRDLGELKAVIEPLEDILGGKVVKENGRFYVKNSKGSIEMSLLAKGHRKVATLAYLLANGELNHNSILLWDEPEANLNPKLTSKVVDLLLLLASKGVQIIIATHDYLLTHLLSLKAEYRETITDQVIPDIKFFSLQQENDAIEVEVGKTLAEIKRNDLLDEFVAFYDLEQRYFNQNLKA
jgi:predicted ATPase